MIQGGGIISAALGLIKEKERQGDKAMDRLHDGMKTQMELTANQGSWTGDSKAKVKEPEEEEESETAPEASEPAEDKKKDDIANMGIIGLAQSAS